MSFRGAENTPSIFTTFSFYTKRKRQDSQKGFQSSSCRTKLKDMQKHFEHQISPLYQNCHLCFRQYTNESLLAAQTKAPTYFRVCNQIHCHHTLLIDQQLLECVVSLHHLRSYNNHATSSQLAHNWQKAL